MNPDMARMLVASDNTALILALKQLLSAVAPETGLMVTANSPSAVPLAVAERADLILLDMAGHSLCRAMKSEPALQGVPVLFAADFQDGPELRNLAVQAGADGFLPMPFDQAGLSTQLKSMLALKSSRAGDAGRMDMPAVSAPIPRMQSDGTAGAPATEVAGEGSDTGRRLDLDTVTLADLLDPEMMRSLLDDFHQITGIASTIVDRDGEVFAASGWQDACVKFHRVHPETLENCRNGFTRFSDTITPGTFKTYLCDNGLMDMATSIEVGGNHMGKVHFGQFFLKEAPPDMEHFREQARNYGFDERDYLDAIGRVPLCERETVEAAVSFFSKITKKFSSLSHSAVLLSETIAEQRRIEQALRASEDKFRLLVENSHAIIYTLDLQGHFTFASPSMTESLGYPVAWTTGRHINEIVHPEDMAACLAVMAKVIEEKTRVQGVEYRVRHADGSWRWNMTNAAPLLDATGALIGLEGIADDITERKLAEAALRESESRHRLLTENMADVVWTMGTDGFFSYVSPSVEKLRGYTPEEIVGTPAADALTPASLVIMLGAVREFMPIIERGAEGYDYEPQIYELEQPRKDGSTVWTETLVRVMFDGEGRCGGFLGVSRDISKRRKLEALQRLLTAAVEQAGETVVITDTDGGILYANPAFERATGYTIQEALGSNPRILKSGIQEEALYRELWDTISHGGTWHGRLVNRRKDGTLYTESATLSPVRDEAGRIVSYVAVKRDITERLQLESLLRESEERHRQIARHSRTITWELDMDGLYRHVGEVMESVLGYRPEELEGRVRYHELHPEEGREQFREDTSSLFQKGAPFHELTGRARTKGGGTVWLSFSGFPLRDESGNLTGYRGSATDITARKLAEESLRESEAEFKNLFENAPVGIFHTLPSGRFLSVNPALARILGWPSPEALMAEVSDIARQLYVSPESRPIILDSVRVSAGWTHFGDVEWRRRDGRIVRLEITARHVTRPDGSTKYFEAFVVDVTEMKLTVMAQEFLLQCGLPGTGEDFFAALARYLSETLHMEYVYISRLSEDGLAAATVAVSIDGKEGGNFHYSLAHTPCARVAEKGVCCFPGEVQKLFPEDTALQDLEVESYLGTTLRDSQGTPLGLIALMGRHEMQNPKRSEFLLNLVAPSAAAEMERRRSEEELQQLKSAIDIANYGIAISDMEGVVIYINEYFAAAHGYTVDELAGVHLSVFHSGEQLAQIAALLDVMVKEGGFVSEDVWHRHRDGRPFPMLMSGKVLRDANGVSKRRVVTAIDLTEVRKLEDQLRQSQKLESVGRLAGGVAHDFNNMLGVILGHTEMILRKTGQGSPFYEDLLEVRKAGERSANLTRQLLAFARKQTAVPKVLDLNETITEMLKMLGRLIGENIDLEWRPGDGLWRVKMDPVQIDQILANLCVNARDAITGVGRVVISTANVRVGAAETEKYPEASPGDYVLLSVADNGCGMDAGTLSRVFEPFFTTKGVGEGTGLGLATVYGILLQNGGFVDVQSSPGAGTTFKLHLPRHAEAAAKQERTLRSSLPKGGGETVLLVEDEQAILRMGKMMLEMLGYNVLAAGGPEEALALEAGHKGPISLLLSDVVMPQMNGRELARRLLEKRPGMRCLFVSGYTADAIARQGILEEGLHFIEKPFRLETFAAAVYEVLNAETT